jgi:multidrug/hemolysin transport system ATP-binding protein
MSNIIEVKNFTHKYGDLVAVNDISFSVKEGALFSFLGTNGAGKSTTINVLTTLLAKHKGDIKIGGCDVAELHKVRKQIGIVFQDSVLDNMLTVRENLLVRGGLYGIKGDALKNATENIISMTDMADYANRRYGKLSGGQKRRADIARALISYPKILFLDEPTTGLDPKTRQDIWNLILKLKTKHKMTVFLTTHYMEEAAESDDIVIIHKGEIKAHGTSAELKEKYAQDKLKIVLKNGEQIEKKLNSTTEALPIINEHGDDIFHVEIISGTLDDVFINVTGGEQC